MLAELFLNPNSVLILSIGFLVALTVHEFAHAAVANHLGDPTARLEGRKTLNPLAHLDPIGTVLLPLFLVFARSPIVFGWGKPVPLDSYNLKDPRRDSALVALSGPVSNLVTAVVLAVILRLIPLLPTMILLSPLLIGLIRVNIMLGVFNLLPLHPLDGAKILLGILSDEQAYKLELFYRQFGLILLVFLLFPFFGTSPIIAVIWPIINFIIRILIPGQASLI